MCTEWMDREVRGESFCPGAVRNGLMLMLTNPAQRIVEIKDSLDLFRTYAT